MYAGIRMAHAPPSTTSVHERSDDGAVVIVASAGGIKALKALLSALPRTFSLPIFVAQHLAPTAPSLLPTILQWRSSLTVAWATDGTYPHQGWVYVAPPGTCLRFAAEGFSITRLDKSSSSWLRSADDLIISVVQHYGARTIAVVLSGSMAAGVAGLRMVKASGGITMAQNQISSSHFDMPRAAIDFAKADFVTSPSRMATVLAVAAEQWTADRNLRVA